MAHSPVATPIRAAVAAPPADGVRTAQVIMERGGEGEHARRLVVARVRGGGGERGVGDGALGPGHAHAAVAPHLHLAHALRRRHRVHALEEVRHPLPVSP